MNSRIDTMKRKYIGIRPHRTTKEVDKGRRRRLRRSRRRKSRRWRRGMTKGSVIKSPSKNQIKSSKYFVAS